jgi:hypothetical protein
LITFDISSNNNCRNWLATYYFIFVQEDASEKADDQMLTICGMPDPIDTGNHEEELNGSDTIPPEETADQEKPIPMSSQEGLPMTTTTQLRSVRTSSGMGMPTIIIDLIMIYDNEEGLEASHITTVMIKQEKEPRETSTPNSDDVTPNAQEGDLVARSTLDTVFLDQLGTKSQNEGSKNDLDTGGHEQGMGQLETNISMPEPPANVDPSPTSLARKKTSSTDEDQ